MPYLDYAGACQPSKELLEQVTKQLIDLKLSNPHSHHSTSRNTKIIVDNTRNRILSHFNTNNDEYSVIFTNNASHSLKIVGESFVFGEKRMESCQLVTELKPGPSFAYLADSHNSVVGLREIVRYKTDFVTCLKDLPHSIPQVEDSSLFVLTAMSNFSGRKYDLNIVKQLQNKGWSVCLDAAGLVSSSNLDLRQVPADFITISFYKMFGYPTGIGALLVKKGSEHKLKKMWFSGGTVASAIPAKFGVRQRKRIEERFEDGTLNFYAIAALQKGFEDMERCGGISRISEHSHKLTVQAYKMLTSKMHLDGEPLVVVYGNNIQDISHHGPILSFNFKDSEGNYIGYSEVAKMADLFGIELRTGCFCNIGACQEWLQLTEEELMRHDGEGKECGDEIDLLDGKPTGAVRISFGRHSAVNDIDILEQMIDYCFLGCQPSTIIDEHPFPIEHYSPSVSHLFCYPVKSCKGISLESSTFTPSGLKFDRHFMIVNNDITLSQKKYPKLCKLFTKMTPEGLLMNSNNSRRSITIPLEDQDENIQQNIICTSTVPVRNCGKAVARWLDEALDMSGCELRRVSQDPTRSLSNDAPYLLVNEASVKILADSINLTTEEIILRFRPNIVIRGLPPFIEDTAEKIVINGAVFEVSGKCTRCEMICVDQETGIKDPALIVALRNIRNRQRMTFGIYIRELESSYKNVHLGDRIEFSH